MPDYDYLQPDEPEWEGLVHPYLKGFVLGLILSVWFLSWQMRGIEARVEKVEDLLVDKAGE